MHAILGLLIILAGVVALARLAREAAGNGSAARGPLTRGRQASRTGRAAGGRAPGGGGLETGFRAGPWPGLTGRGAAVLVVCAGWLFGFELMVGLPQRGWPDLVWVAVLAAVPPLAGTCLVRAPGCAAAVCGVYLLGRSVASLLEPSLELPPLLLPSAVASDLAVWVRRGDLRWPSLRQAWRRRLRVDRRLTTWRVALGGAAFGVVLALVQPPFAILLGSDPAGWATAQVVLAGISAGVSCALAGAAIERITNAAGPPG